MITEDFACNRCGLFFVASRDGLPGEDRGLPPCPECRMADKVEEA